ncbi:MAG: RHS repeat-associated core domain-containing protein [Acidobacteriota bacterium]
MLSRSLSFSSCLARRVLFVTLLAIGLPAYSAPAAAAPTEGTACTGSVSWAPGANGPNRGANCASLFRCYPPVLGEPQWSVAGGCDPSTGPCGITVELPVELPGNHQNDPATVGFGYSFAQLRVEDDDGTLVGACGNAGQAVTEGQGTLSWGLTASCGDAAGRFEVRVETCPCPFVPCPLCPESETVTVDLEDSVLCPEPPKEECPGGAGDCRSCLSVGGGGAPAAGGGGGFGGSTGAPTGPGARLRYKAGGAGHGSWPGSTDWRPTLGRGWSHDYAQRLVPDPDSNRVWWITPWATFREFSGLSGGVYTRVSPSDEYRTLRQETNGWSLIELDGTVSTFDAEGRWLATADRFGNTKTATYGVGLRGEPQLQRVDFADGRHELFAYDGATGKLSSITEVGVDDLTSRSWSYLWIGDDLQRIDLPDGQAYEFLYDDLRHPGYLTRVERLGSAGGRRVEVAWSYDALGNVMEIWRGDISPTGPDAVDRWRLSFDAPALPRISTVTDPLDEIATYTFGRDPGQGGGPPSRKPRLEGLSGSCATCGLAPNATLIYGDADHPLLPTRELDGRGVATDFGYTPFGQLALRTEAAGSAQQCTTSWSYHPTYPSLVTNLEQPSTVGGGALRTTTWSYDAAGALVERREEGSEEPKGAFSYVTTHTPTPQGLTASMDPPGYGTDDLVAYAYDPARGGLLMSSRTDPLIGTTTFGYDPFHRRSTLTDPNGVTTTSVYDLGDRMTFSIHEGVTDSEDLVTEYRYTEFGQLQQTILPRGNVLEYAYDAAGRLTSLERKPDLVTPAERTLYTLDAIGNRTREEHQRWNSVSGAWETRSWTETLWQSRCHREATLHADGTRTEYAYDCEGRLEKVWDANHPSANQSTPPTSEFIYDDLGRLVTLTQPWGGSGGGLATTSYSYDVQDHLATVTDAEGNLTTYRTGDRDLLTTEVSPVSGTTTHRYNEHGELIESTDARGVLTQRTVDALDRVTEIRYDSTPASLGPQAQDQRADEGTGPNSLGSQDAELRTTFTYDDPAVPFSRGRLTAIRRPDAPVDVSVEYTYDRFGRLLRDGDLTYTYDANGNRISILYPGSHRALYTFDYADRHHGLTLQVPGEPDQPIASDAIYEPSGPLAQLTLGNGLVETRTYTPRYFPESIRVAPVPGSFSSSKPGTSTEPGSPKANPEGAPLFHWTYTTDALGNPLTINDQIDPANHRTYTYQDFQYFLTLGNGPWGDLSWTYDRIGNRLTETRDGATDTYAYHPNPSSGNTALLATITPAAGGLRTYTFGPAGHLQLVDLPANPIQFHNNAAGRLSRIQRPAGDAAVDLTYDGRSFLRHAQASTLSEIFSDGFETGDGGCWVGRATAGEQVEANPECIRDRFLKVQHSEEGTLSTLLQQPSPHTQNLGTYLSFNSRIVFQLDQPKAAANEAHWLIMGQNGELFGSSDEQGNIAWNGSLSPFGSLEGSIPNESSRLRLAGQLQEETWNLAATGIQLAYNLHRWYSADLGRYLKPEPIRWLQFSDHYLYSENRPTIVSDPKGLAPCSTLSEPEPGSCCKEGYEGLAPSFRHLLRQRALYCSNKDKPAIVLDLNEKRGWIEIYDFSHPVAHFQPQGNPCIDWCICIHEQLHIQQARSGELRAKGTNAAECEAYNVHIRCLTRLTSSGPFISATGAFR